MYHNFMPFLWFDNIPLFVYAVFCLSIHLWMDTGSFHVLVIMNNAAINISNTNICLKAFIILDIYLRVELLGHMIVLYLKM